MMNLNCFVMERVIQNYIQVLGESFFGPFKKSARFNKAIKDHNTRLSHYDPHEMLIASIFMSDGGAGDVRDDHSKSMLLRCWQHIASNYDSCSIWRISFHLANHFSPNCQMS